MRILLDSSVAGLLLFDEVDSGDVGRQGAARALALPEEGHTLLLGTPSLVELLGGVAQERLRETAVALRSMFVMLDIDSPAAYRASTLHSPFLRQRGSDTRARVKFDTLIAGLALVPATGVEGFCTYDQQQAARVAEATPDLVVGEPPRFLASKGVPLFPQAIPRTPTGAKPPRARRRS